jgi:hypothetical protein
MILYRPMDMEELRLVYDTGMSAFPPRKPEQPIFYPVLSLQYANEIASKWNVQSGSASGYVARFTLDDAYAAHFEPQRVGGSHHIELWVPSEELSRFNKYIVPTITIISAYFGENFRGYVPSQFGLRGKDASAQFVALAHTLDYSGMDFVCEIAANHLTVFFLNYAFWAQGVFSKHGIAEAQQDRVLVAIRRTWVDTFPHIHLPLTDAMQ